MSVRFHDRSRFNWENFADYANCHAEVSVQSRFASEPNWRPKKPSRMDQTTSGFITPRPTDFVDEAQRRTKRQCGCETVPGFLRGRPDAHLCPNTQILQDLGSIKATKHDEPFRHVAGFTRGA